MKAEDPIQGETKAYIYKGLSCVFSVRELEERRVDCDKNFYLGENYFMPVEKLIRCRVLEREE